MFVDPDGEFVFSLFLGPLGAVLDAACWGAVIGGASYTLDIAMSNGGFQNWSWGDFGKSVGFGALAGAATFGIGQGFAAAGNFAGGFGTSVLQGAAHGSGFASGTLSSWAGSAYQASGLATSLGRGGMYGFGALSGGIGSWATGGNFWKGAASGLMVTGLNHLRHGIKTFTDKKAAQQYMWENSFDKNGDPDYENFAWITKNGEIVVLPNDKNGPTRAKYDNLPLRYKKGKLQVYANRWVDVTGSIHTHPVTNGVNGIGVSTADKNFFNHFKLPTNQVIFNNQLYNVLQNCKGLWEHFELAK